MKLWVQSDTGKYIDVNEVRVADTRVSESGKSWSIAVMLKTTSFGQQMIGDGYWKTLAGHFDSPEAAEEVIEAIFDKNQHFVGVNENRYNGG